MKPVLDLSPFQLTLENTRLYILQRNAGDRRKAGLKSWDTRRNRGCA